MNILIVDDEELIRRWLSMLLMQIDKRFTLYYAEHGAAALKVCQEQEIQLIITDIRMPECDGISLLEEVRVRWPRISVVVLSAYDDFTYVRSALQHGALDYILKAEMNIEDIKRVLEKVNQQKVHEELSQDDRMQSAAFERRKEIFMQYINTPGMEDGALLEMLGESSDENGWEIALFRLRTVGQQTHISRSRVCEICDCQIAEWGGEGKAIWLKGNKYLLIFHMRHQSGSSGMIFYRFFSQLDQMLENQMGVVVQYSINLKCAEYGSIRKAYRYADEILMYREYYCDNHITPEELDGQSDWQSLKDKSYGYIKNCLKHEEYQKAVEAFQKTIQEKHREKLKPQLVKKAVYTIHYALLLDAPWNADESCMRKIDTVSGQLRNIKTAEEMERWSERFAQAYMEAMSGAVQIMSPCIHQAVEYIKEHFTEKISLEDLAAYVHLNKTYLSGLFKKEMQVNFHEYLETLRIQYARELIRNTNKQMSEIAELAGFSNQNYFTKTFRKVMGKSPLQYKRQNLNDH